VLQRSYQWSAESGKRAGEENGIVIAYDITNTGSVAAALTGVRVGLALDADLMTAGGAADDIVSYDGANNILYMYDSGVVCASEPTVDCTSGHLGVAVLSDAAAGKAAGTIAPATATCFAVGTVPECPAWAELISAYDLMSSGINTELAAGPVTARDYRMLIAAQPFELAALETKTVVFALAMGDGAAEMAANVAALSARYEAAIVGVEDELAVDESIEFTVSNSYPNPFAQATNLDVHLPEAGHLRVTVYDVIGRQVARLVDETVPSGQHTLTWDASNEPTGVYFFEVVTNSKQRTGQMVVAH
jgi:hypothetical protein